MKVIYWTALVAVSLFLILTVILGIWIYRSTKDFDCLVRYLSNEHSHVQLTKGQVLIHRMRELARKSTLAVGIVILLTDFVIPLIIRMT